MLHEQPQLHLKKDYITPLAANQSKEVVGGFTYSLSLGARCQASKAATQGNPYDCGIVLASSERCAQLTLVSA